MPAIKEKAKNKFKIDPEEMAEAGLHLGHRTSKIFPKMNPYIYGVRSNIHIIDLEKTAKKLQEALEFANKVISEGKNLLLVGTKVQAKKLVKEFAKKHEIPYVSERWLGGTFTNFGVIKKRIEYLKDLEEKKKKGELEKYTKKEKMKIEKKIRDLENKLGGIKGMTELPGAIFILDMKKDNLAVREARKKGVKIIGISDTNIDPTIADYPIPANDDALSSIKYILEKLGEALKKTK